MTEPAQEPMGQVCTRCVMDASASDIVFDHNGVCSYCTEFLERSGVLLDQSPEIKRTELMKLTEHIKAQGRGKPYDCIVGVSGGVDSSWVLVQAVEMGLRPLAVHMDNGWNTELAQNNIAQLVKTLNVDLYTYVIDWEEYRSLMQAFFDADVLDVELLYDNAMLAVNYRQAAAYGLRYILAGTNQATEGMRIPRGWNWFKYDKRNIRALASRNHTRMNTFPAIGTLDFIAHAFVRRIRWISILDYLPYNKSEVLDALELKYQYKRYPYKHYESVFTRFYQGYLLPRKFRVDKRRLHFSTLVASGQMARKEALDGLSGIAYASNEDLASDIRYFLKKMGWTNEQLEQYLHRPEVSHSAYPSERPFWEMASRFYRMIK